MAISTISEYYNPPKGEVEAWKWLKYDTVNERIYYRGKFLTFSVIKDNIQFPVRNGDDNHVVIYDKWMTADPGNTRTVWYQNDRNKSEKIPYGFCVFETEEDAQNSAYHFNDCFLVRVQTKGIFVKGNGGYPSPFCLAKQMLIPSTIKTQLIQKHKEEWEALKRANGFTK